MTPTTLPSTKGGVLVASSSTSFRQQVRRSIADSRGPVQEAQGGADALVKLESGQWQLLLLDRRLPDLDAEELVGIIKRRFPGIEVVVVDSDRDGLRPSSAAAMGGYDSWLKPAPEPASEDTWLMPSAAELACERVPSALPGMIGESAVMLRLYRMTRLVAPRNLTVLVQGATGTGKELVARAIHTLSPRAAKPFVVVNCAAIPEALLESELFGHARGAFTGAVQSYLGRIQLAQGGTLFLDEIGELPLSLQAKFLRFLEQKEIQRLGSVESVKVEVRVVAATNADLEHEASCGRFREDLYYRLAAFPLELPPLVERGGDVRLLAEHFVAASKMQPQSAPRLTAAALARIESHSWPGNVRELQQVIDRAAILCDGGDQILPEHLHLGRRHCVPAEKSAGIGPV